MHRKGIYLVVGSFVFILLLMPISPVLKTPFSTTFHSNIESSRSILAYTPHTPISIDGDNNFSQTALSEGWDGDGSSEYPYEIVCLEIDRAGGIGHCINITNTRVNFTIQSCNLTGASIGSGAGIYLNNVSYGVLRNNTCSSNRIGIYLIGSHINTLANNTCTSNVHGIYMYDSDYNTIADNDCTGNSNYGMYQNYCDSNIFSRNSCVSNGIDGIHAEEADQNTFTKNTCNGNGQDGIDVLNHPHGNILSNNTCNANNYYGIRFFNDYNDMIPAIVANNTCVSNDYGIRSLGIRTTFTHNVLLDNFIGFEIDGDESVFSYNTITQNDVGFSANMMSYCIFSHNTIEVFNEGFWIMYGDDNIISHNSIISERFGIDLEYGSGNNIFLNDIIVDYDSWDPYFWVGIYLGSMTGDTNVTLNRIERGYDYLPDTVTIRDQNTGSSNFIDRNFYDDYGGSDADDDGVGETSYVIPGNAGNVDLHPLVYSPFAPEWIDLPIDQVLDYWDQPFYYDLDATAPSPITWQVNDTSQFSIDSSGVVQSIVDLPVDQYGLRIIVTNIYGVSISKVFQLTVQEITPPEWIVGPIDIVLELGESVDVGLIATDQSGIILYAINDTINFNLSVTQLNVTGYQNGWHLLHITNDTILPTGRYTINVSVSDPYGNVLVGILSILIHPLQDSTPPIWIVEPLDETIESTTSFVQRLGAWDESGIHHWWLNDSLYFIIDESGVIRNATILENGVYYLEVRAYDPFDNYCSAVFVITIIEHTPSTTTITSTAPSTTTTSVTQNGFDPLIPLGIFGSATLAAIALIFVVLSKKKN
ncbi:MAG: nitrous oxide reductase family maturation protein NosD [Candidatus Thorarchaeota archaeon]